MCTQLLSTLKQGSPTPVGLALQRTCSPKWRISHSGHEGEERVGLRRLVIEFSADQVEGIRLSGKGPLPFNLLFTLLLDKSGPSRFSTFSRWFLPSSPWW